MAVTERIKRVKLLKNQESDQIITLDEVKFMLKPNPSSIDQETAKALTKFKLSIMERRIQKVNQLNDFFASAWPSGSPLLYYVALELAADDQHILAEKLTHHDFFKSVLSELNARMLATKKTENDHRTKYNVDIDDEDDQDDFFVESNKQAKKSKELWSQYEIEKFKELYFLQGPFKNWKNVVKHFPKKTQAQCKALYQKLHESGEIGWKSISPENPEDSETIEIIPPTLDHHKYPSLHSISFIYRDKNAVVGPKSRLFERMSVLNPIPGYIDQITMQPMTMPALSPDGYVLDYSTWIKLLNEKKVNPFTQNHMKSKRELIILSQENFFALKDSIVNLEECQPQDF